MNLLQRLFPFVETLASGEEVQINRRPSTVVAVGVPWLSVALGSLLTTNLWVASAPLLPPLGLLILIAWRQLRPGVQPVWAGLPLGLFDDLVSGQPMGSAVLLWSAALLLLDALEARVPWRNFLIEWVVASVLIAAAIVLGALIANVTGGATPLVFTAPQIGVSILIYPLVGRFVARLDRMRRLPFLEVRAWD